VEWEFFNIDYKKFRLFQMAVLFRSAVSTHEAFEHVRFNDPELDKLRYYLNSGEAPEEDEFPCLVEGLLEEDSPSLCERIIGAPKIYKGGYQTYIWYVFGGFNWYFVLPRLSQEELSFQSYVSKAGYMRIPVMFPWQHPWLRKSMAMTAAKNASSLS